VRPRTGFQCSERDEVLPSGSGRIRRSCPGDTFLDGGRNNKLTSGQGKQMLLFGRSWCGGACCSWVSAAAQLKIPSRRGMSSYLRQRLSFVNCLASSSGLEWGWPYEMGRPAARRLRDADQANIPGRIGAGRIDNYRCCGGSSVSGLVGGRERREQAWGGPAPDTAGRKPKTT
jgi:hypothetical protein